ncbi:hypothetical protein GCM10009546_73440 [Actinomadura livida]|uniref:Uncharacterized protein n=1 Tax=Actinomadura livida TaxID=79909 RepID=A0ABN1FZ00_9ACTN|nr:hypothetical protein GCM10010208_71430 [Actinomadura livida]
MEPRAVWSVSPQGPVRRDRTDGAFGATPDEESRRPCGRTVLRDELPLDAPAPPATVRDPPSAAGLPRRGLGKRQARGNRCARDVKAADLGAPLLG